MLALLALSAFVFDYGVMWVEPGTGAERGRCRRAGRRYLAGPSTAPPIRHGARARAIAWPHRNRVWGQAPSVTPDVTFPAVPSGRRAPPTRCVRVDVFRNQNPRQRAAHVLRTPRRHHEPGCRGHGDGADRPPATHRCLRPWTVVERGQRERTQHRLPTPHYDSAGQGKEPAAGRSMCRQRPERHRISLPEDYGRRFAIKIGDQEAT